DHGGVTRHSSLLSSRPKRSGEPGPMYPDGCLLLQCRATWVPDQPCGLSGTTASTLFPAHMRREPERKLRPEDHHRQHHEHDQVERDRAVDDFGELAVPDALDHE